MCKPETRQPIVPDQLIDALEGVLARLWSVELLDYHDNGGDSQPDAGQHLFPKLEIIRHWLDYVEEACGRG